MSGWSAAPCRHPLRPIPPEDAKDGRIVQAPSEGQLGAFGFGGVDLPPPGASLSRVRAVRYVPLLRSAAEQRRPYFLALTGRRTASIKRAAAVV
jgi:hypothetical protein